MRDSAKVVMVYDNQFEAERCKGRYKDVLIPYSESILLHYLVFYSTNNIHEWRDLQFKVDSERQIFEKLFIAIFFYSKNFYQKALSRRRNIFSYCIMLEMSVLGFKPWLYV